MPVDDAQLDERELALIGEIRAAFDELSLSPAQRRRLRQRFAEHVGTMDSTAAGSTGRAFSGARPHELNGRAEPQQVGSSRTRLSRGLELAAVILLILLLGAGALVVRSLIPSHGSSQLGASGAAVTTVYAVQEDSVAAHLLPLDPTTLADQGGAPVTPSSASWAVSADGSTSVTVEYDPDGIVMMVRDGVTGAVRQRFRSPLQKLLSTVTLNRDGSRLLVNVKLDPSQWSVIDTTNGQLLSTIKSSGTTFNFSTPMHAEDLRLSPDGSRVYRFIFTNSANGSGTVPLQIVAFDATTGQQIARQTLPGVQVGTWSVPQPGSIEPLTFFQQPGVDISPDGSQIAIVTPDGQTITLLNAQSLTVERTIQVARPAGLLDRLLSTLGLRPQHALAKNLDGTLRDAAYSADGKELYIWATTFADNSTGGMQSGELTRVDLSNGKATSQTLRDSQISQVQPSPDGKSVYVAGYLLSTETTSNFIQRLDAQTLQSEAQRTWSDVYGFTLVTAKEANNASATPAGIEPWPTLAGDPSGLTLKLSKSIVAPGEIITRTVTGTAGHPTTSTSGALMLDELVGESWRTIYYLGISDDNPVSWPAGPQSAMTANAPAPSALEVRIPDVAPGTYRVRQDVTLDMSNGSGTGVTLYTTITVVAP